MTPKKTTRKKVTDAARSMAGKFVKAVKSVAKAAGRSRAAKPEKNPLSAVPAGKKFAPKKAPAVAAAKPAPKAKKSAPVKPRTAAPRATEVAVSVPRAAESRLPEHYGTKRLFLVARDPRWLYAHWDFSREEQHALNQLSADGHLSLRVHLNAPDGRLVTQTKLQAESRHWFLPVAQGETKYVAELGYDSARGAWVSLAFSNPVVTPSETIAPDTSIMLATLPPDVPFQEVLETLAPEIIVPPVAENPPVPEIKPKPAPLSLVEVIQQVRENGRTELPQITVVPSERRWTPKQARLLAKLAGPQRIRHRMWSELASLSAAHILPEIEPEILEELSPAEAPGPAFETDWENSEDFLAGMLPAEDAFSPAGGWGGDNSGGASSTSPAKF
jgi:hypothetical protein